MILSTLGLVVAEKRAAVARAKAELAQAEADAADQCVDVMRASEAAKTAEAVKLAEVHRGGPWVVVLGGAIGLASI